MSKFFLKVSKQLVRAASSKVPLATELPLSKVEPTHHFKSGFSKKMVLGGLLVSGLGLFIFNDKGRKKEGQEPQETIEVSDYFYHSIGGFDLYKLASILELGVLSKQAADNREVPTSGVERAYFRKDRVSVTTPLGLQVEAYAGGHLSFIILKANLNIMEPSEFVDEDRIDDALSYERQIQDEIPRDNIRGIMIPDIYFSTPLTKLKVCALDEQLVANIENLDSLIYHEFSRSLMSCPKIRQYYGEALQREDAIARASYAAVVDGDVLNRWQRIEAAENSCRAKNKIEADLNASIMRFIKKAYAEKLEKENPTPVDIIYYHTRGRCELYNTSGQLFTPTIEPLAPEITNPFAP